MVKYFCFIFIAAAALLSGCVFIPCTTTLQINNGNDPGEIVFIDSDNNLNRETINANEEKFYDNDAVKKIRYFYLRSGAIEGYFELSEFDHGGPAKHEIVIEAAQDEFIIDSGRKKIAHKFNYKFFIDGVDSDEITGFPMMRKESYETINKLLTSYGIK